MSRQIQIRRGTKNQHASFTGAIGEVTMDTTNNTLRVHDGVTVGGNEMLSRRGFYSYITNCITEIPQDIKLELNNGTLTLKAGSKVYVPNGAGVFDVRNINTDTAMTAPSGTGRWALAISPGGSLLTRNLSYCTSGAGATATGGFAYDTTANIITWYNMNSEPDYAGTSFPVCIFTTTNSVVTSIDQVFNGFGYIGSTVFVLPGVKGLIPNGRNDDGTLKNIFASNTTVHTYTSKVAFDAVIGMNASGVIDCYTSLVYAPEQNKNYQSGAPYARFHAGTVVFGTGGNIESFEPKQVFLLGFIE